MKASFIFFVFFHLLLLGLLPDEAEAQMNWDRRVFGKTTGFLIEGGFSVNGITDDDYVTNSEVIISNLNADVDPLVGLYFGFGHRPIEYFSVELSFHYGFLNADSPNTTDERAGFFALLAEFRGYLPIQRFHPWIGFGIGYAMTHISAEEFPLSPNSSAHLALHGVGFGLSSGVMIFVLDSFAITPYMRFVFGYYPTACVRYENMFLLGDDEDCDSTEDVYDVDEYSDLPDMPHLWTVGIQASYLF